MDYRPLEQGKLDFLRIETGERDAVATAIEQYLTTYAGRHFERLDGGGDRGEVANRITCVDLVAVSALSVQVPIGAAVALAEHHSSMVSELLSRIPSDLDLWDAEPDERDDPVGPASAAAELWTLVNRLPGMGWVTTGKLLARKRPRLLPVYDSVVKGVLGRSDGEEFWRPLRDVLSQQEWPRSRVKDLAAGPGRGQITPLRAFDIAVWMRGAHPEAIQ